MNQKIFLSLFALAGIAMLGCKKNEFRRDEYDTPTGKAIVKVAYFSADSVSRSAQIYINNQLVSNSINSFTPFPGGGYNTGGNTDNGYLAVDASKGTADFKFVTANPGSTIISKELFTVSAPVFPNVQQIVFITDTAANTNAFTVKAEADRPDSGFVKMQFVNCIPDSGPISFYFKDSLVADNLKYKESIDFRTLPLYVDTLKIYPTGVAPTVANRIAFYSFAGIGNQKIYSALCRGYIKAKTTGDIRIPKVSLVIVK
jgi:hypothetical protein